MVQLNVGLVQTDSGREANNRAKGAYSSIL